MAENTPLTGYEPSILDSETTEIFFQKQSSDTVPSHLFDVELDDETIGKSAIFTTVHSREENQRTEDKLITLLKKVCCQLSPCLSVMQERGDPSMIFVR